MYSSDMVFLKSVFQQSIIERNYTIGLDNISPEVDSLDINELTDKILILPEYMQSLLFMKYVFGSDPNAAEDMLSISDAKQKLQYVEALLSHSLKLFDNQRISNASMKQATGAALGKLMLENDTTASAKNPNYSNKFRSRLKDIKAAQIYNNHVSLRRVGIAIVAAIIAFAMTITASANVRERFFSWLVETFPLFSQFTSVITNQPSHLDFERLRKMKLNYIPKGFMYISVFEADPMLVFSYEDSTGKFLSINASLSTGSPILADTENTQVNEIIFNEQIAYWWEKDGLCYFIWQQDGFELNIVGQISHEEAIKIAENTQI